MCFGGIGDWHRLDVILFFFTSKDARRYEIDWMRKSHELEWQDVLK